MNQVTEILGLPFFLKKQEVKRPIRKIGIIFNYPDHSSFTSAVLFKMIYEASDLINQKELILLDVRDAFPSDIDQYFWFGTGTISQFREYYHGMMEQINSEEERKWYTYMRDNSTRFTSQKVQDPEPSDNVVGQMLAYALEKELLSVDQHQRYMRFAVLAENFMTEELSAEEACAYYNVLNLANQNYHGSPLKIEDFYAVTKVTDEEIKLFIEEQSQINRVISNKCRQVIFGDNLSFYIVTTTSADCHGLLRRLALSKKKVVHVTMGSYAPVVYSVHSVPKSIVSVKTYLDITAQDTVVKKFKAM